jgi:hypothetical protein
MKSLAVLVGVALVGATGALASTAVAPTKLVVKAAQVGPGYVLVPYEAARTLSRPTLDMCHMTFPSEALRTARDRVTFQRGENDPTIANEVVAYKPGGAAQAMRDIRGSVKRCPNGPVKSGKASITTQITVLHLHGKLLPGFVALEIRASGTVAGKAVALDGTALYQRRGNILSGVFAYASSPLAGVQLMLHTAEQSARVLEARA